MWYMHEGMGWWMVFGIIWMIFLWGGIIALIAWGISKFVKRDHLVMTSGPLDIAKERYAKGEISREEYEEIKKSLR